MLPFLGAATSFSLIRGSFLVSIFNILLICSLRSWIVLLNAIRPNFLPNFLKKRIQKLPSFIGNLFFNFEADTINMVIDAMVKNAIFVEDLINATVMSWTVYDYEFISGETDGNPIYGGDRLLSLTGYWHDGQFIPKKRSKPWNIFESQESLFLEKLQFFAFTSTILYIHFCNNPYQQERMRIILNSFISLMGWIFKNGMAATFNVIPFIVRFMSSLILYDNKLNNNFTVLLSLSLVTAFVQTLPFLISTILFSEFIKREIIPLIRTAMIFIRVSYSRGPKAVCLTGKTPFFLKIISNLVFISIFIASFWALGDIPAQLFEAYTRETLNDFSALLNKRGLSFITQLHSNYPNTQAYFIWFAARSQKILLDFSFQVILLGHIWPSLIEFIGRFVYPIIAAPLSRLFPTLNDYLFPRFYYSVNRQINYISDMFSTPKFGFEEVAEAVIRAAKVGPTWLYAPLSRNDEYDILNHHGFFGDGFRNLKKPLFVATQQDTKKQAGYFISTVIGIGVLAAGVGGMAGMLYAILTVLVAGLFFSCHYTGLKYTGFFSKKTPKTLSPDLLPYEIAEMADQENTLLSRQKK